jgi:hypothetical protein
MFAASFAGGSPGSRAGARRYHGAAPPRRAIEPKRQPMSKREDRDGQVSRDAHEARTPVYGTYAA